MDELVICEERKKGGEKNHPHAGKGTLRYCKGKLKSSEERLV